MRSVVSLTVLQNVNAPNPKRPAKKNQKHRESPMPRPAMDLATSLATNPIAIAATQIALMNVRRSLMSTISPPQPATMTFQHQRRHFLSASTQIGAHGLHAVQHVSTATIPEPDRDREIVTKHQIVNVKIIYMKRKSVQLMTQLLLVSFFIIFETARTVDFNFIEFSQNLILI